MKKKWLLHILFLLTLLIPGHALSLQVRVSDHEDYSRFVLQGDREFDYELTEGKNTLQILVKKKADVDDNTVIPRDSRLFQDIACKIEKKSTIFTIRLKSPFRIDKHVVLVQPFRVVLDLVAGEESPAEKREETDIPAPVIPNLKTDIQGLDPDKSGKKTVFDTICLDPGHGGSDLGAVGSGKTFEKDITLKVAQKLRRYIEAKLGLRVVLARDSDADIPLDSRVAVANNQEAQIFISIHVNSSSRKSANGPETYFVSLKATDQDAFNLAQQENQSLDEIEKIAAEDELKMILWNMAQAEYIRESSKLAEFIQAELNDLLNTSNRGVKQAPFRVLMRAAMPAVLIEIAFLSNPAEEKKLKDESFLDDVAASIYQGISRFIVFQSNLQNK